MSQSRDTDEKKEEKEVIITQRTQSAMPASPYFNWVPSNPNYPIFFVPRAIIINI